MIGWNKILFWYTCSVRSNNVLKIICFDSPAIPYIHVLIGEDAAAAGVVVQISQQQQQQQQQRPSFSSYSCIINIMRRSFRSLFTGNFGVVLIEIFDSLKEKLKIWVPLLLNYSRVLSYLILSWPLLCILLPIICSSFLKKRNDQFNSLSCLRFKLY